MTGEALYEWFTSKFIYVLDHYDEAFRETWHFKPTPQLDFPPLEDDSIIDPYTGKFIITYDITSILYHQEWRKVFNIRTEV